MGIEKRTNPFLLCDSESAFLQLKATWASFKNEHGLK
jgi:hypothetical protein